MEDRWRAIAAADFVGRAAVAVGLLVIVSLLSIGAVEAEPLDQKIAGLFGGQLNTTIQGGIPQGQQLNFAEQFNNLNAELAAARSQAPIPSASGTFRFTWDGELDTFVRSAQDLGDLVAERAQTLGRHTATVSVSYTRVDFDTLEGQPLGNLHFSQPALSADFVNGLPPADQMKYGNDTLNTNLDLGLGFDLFFFTAAFGITDSIDVSLALSVNRARMSATAVSQIQNGNAAGNTLFLTNSMGNLASSSGHLCEKGNFQCATDSFQQTAFGTGDLFLRGKWHFYDTPYVDLAAAAVLTLPTGNADDFLGFHDPTFTPWLIASKTFGRVSPHLNLGYAFRSSSDVSQGEWVAGADVRTFDWLTLASDFLGYHDNKRDGINDDVIQSAVGFKLNPFGQFVIGGNFQFPVNRDGLRANVIYTGQVEYTF